jgi:hypothetical protein
MMCWIKKLEDSKPDMQLLMEVNNRDWSDPFEASRMVRRKFRVEKKVMEEIEREAEEFSEKKVYWV